MNKLVTGIVFATSLVLCLPGSAANHGQAAVYQGSDGSCTVAAAASYNSGDGDFQIWDVALVGAGSCTGVDSCTGFGSIEVGFVDFGCQLGSTFNLGGTGDFHAFPNLDVDQHAVTITFLGVTVPGTVTVVL